MNIWGVTSTQGSQGLAALKGVEAAGGTQAAVQQGVSEVHDSVTLSVDGVRAAESTGDIRFDRVNAIRAAIADGSYETPEKLDLALDRLADVVIGAWAEFLGDEVARPVAHPFLDVIARDDEVLAVVTDAPHDQMDMGMLGVPMGDADPFEPRVQILLHLADQIAGEGLEVRHQIGRAHV